MELQQSGFTAKALGPAEQATQGCVMLAYYILLFRVWHTRSLAAPLLLPHGLVALGSTLLARERVDVSLQGQPFEFHCTYHVA